MIPPMVEHRPPALAADTYQPHHEGGVVKESSSAFTAMSLVFTISGEIFAYVTIFDQTIEVVTFRLRGCCMLDVFLLPAFTSVGHEC